MNGRSTSVVGLATAAAVLLAAPAIAQQPEPYKRTGSRIAKPVEQLDAGGARQMLKGVARCVYHDQPDTVERYLRSSDPLAVDYASFGIAQADVIKEFDLPACMNETKAAFQLRTSMRMSGPAFRVALAEEAYLGRHTDALKLPADGPEMLTNRFFVQAASMPQAQALGAFADCVVFHAPAEADDMLRTAPGTKAESDAARALVPALSECLVAGREVRLDEKGIRDIVADGLWSRSHYGQTAAEAAE
ncbi:hypothetical protein GRI75_12085 [Altererythrobacter soli]|uniref:Uncharacterized protein n=1 Tax=Croceibacterium soli TaxID=1739690 RepID=A0A6I4UX92_9SPHN|nr:hypothetical protein [Croceibacterium soli]MXP42379.1 hypothetical protein [Croceibacterium soli]